MRGIEGGKEEGGTEGGEALFRSAFGLTGARRMPDLDRPRALPLFIRFFHGLGRDFFLGSDAEVVEVMPGAMVVPRERHGGPGRSRRDPREPVLFRDFRI
jgi:hypothetical protein